MCPDGFGCTGGGVCIDRSEPVLEKDDVRAIMQSAALALDRELAVVVTDRRGVILGAATNFPLDYAGSCATGTCPAAETGCPAVPTPASDCRTVDLAVQLARAASFFSANETPLTSRSVRFLSGEHFPPDIRNTGAAALFGIENTNRGCTFDADLRPLESVLPPARNLRSFLRQRAGAAPLRCESGGDANAKCGCTSGIATIPGAVPIYKNENGKLAMVGGVGVALRGVELVCDPVAAFDSTSILRLDDGNPDFALQEFAARAFAGDAAGLPGVAPKGLMPVCQNSAVDTPACCIDGCDFNVLPARSLPFDPVIFVDGIEIPEIAKNPRVPDSPGTELSNYIVDPMQTDENDPAVAAQPVPIGWLVPPSDSSPGAAPLSAAEVEQIVRAGIAEAGRIRAAIRLPLQQRTAMQLAVSDTRGVLLGLFRMVDATVFSADVAVAKSRNVEYFSSEAIDPLDAMDCPGVVDCRGEAFPVGTAITNRTISFGAQPFFPSGIEGSLRGFPSPFAPGPFRRIFIQDSANACSNGLEPPNGRQNGIVFFPGSAPLYRDGQLIGGLGVSGDGVEQDDIVSGAGAAAAPGFEPPALIRADRFKVRGVRLPYLKFNRRPEQ